MTTARLCGLCLMGVLLLLFLRQSKPDFAPLVTLTLCVMLGGVGIASLLPAVDFMQELPLNESTAQGLTVMLKSLGLAFITQTTAEFCRDAGESAVASKVELIGRAEILLLCLPMLRELMSITAEVLTL